MSIVLPEACTLPTAERPVRLAEFDDLFATAVRRVEPVTATHLRLHLAGPAGLAARVQELTTRETACCSFFTFTTTSQTDVDDEAVALDVTVPAAYAGVLGSFAQRASTVSAGGHGAGAARILAARLQAAAAALVCDLAADGGDADDRIAVWRQVLARVERRDPLPGTTAKEPR
jgi:hypothetical protein